MKSEFIKGQNVLLVTIQGIIGTERPIQFLPPLTINVNDLRSVKYIPRKDDCVVEIYSGHSTSTFLRITKHEYLQLVKHFFPNNNRRYIPTYDEITPTPKFINSILSLNEPEPQNNKLMRLK